LNARISRIKSIHNPPHPRLRSRSSPTIPRLNDIASFDIFFWVNGTCYFSSDSFVLKQSFLEKECAYRSGSSFENTCEDCDLCVSESEKVMVCDSLSCFFCSEFESVRCADILVHFFDIVAKFEAFFFDCFLYKSSVLG